MTFWQLIQPNVQNSTMTTLPRSAAHASGAGTFTQVSLSTGGAIGPARACTGVAVTAAACGVESGATMGSFVAERAVVPGCSPGIVLHAASSVDRAIARQEITRPPTTPLIFTCISHLRPHLKDNLLQKHYDRDLLFLAPWAPVQAD